MRRAPLAREAAGVRVIPSGSQMEHLGRSYLGGVMDFVTMFFAGGNAIVDEAADFRLEKLVGVKRFYRGSATDYLTVQRFYGLRERVKLAEKELKKNPDKTEVAAFKKQYGGILSLGRHISKTDKFLNKYRRLKEKAGELVGKEKKQQLDKLEDDRVKHMLKVLVLARNLDINA